MTNRGSPSFRKSWTSSISTYDEFVDSIWNLGNSDLGGLPEIAYCVVALSGEVGELADKYKKACREKHGEVDGPAMLLELGDALYYLTKIAHCLDYDLPDIADANVAKLSSRRDRGVMHGSGDER